MASVPEVTLREQERPSPEENPHVPLSNSTSLSHLTGPVYLGMHTSCYLCRFFQYLNLKYMVAHACNSSTWEAKAERIKATICYMRPWLKKRMSSYTGSGGTQL